MSAVIVHAHPRRDSFSAALCERVSASARDHALVRIGEGESLDQTDLADATAATFVYPTWWGGLPAMLLAEIGSLIGPWVDGAERAESSPLASIQSLRVVTTHGSSKFINVLQGEPGLQFWKRTVLPLCAPDATFAWRAMYKLDRASDDDRRQFLDSLAT